jgi:hypothetical protein
MVNILSHLLYYLQTSTARIMARMTEEQIKTRVSKIYENRNLNLKTGRKLIEEDRNTGHNLRCILRPLYLFLIVTSVTPAASATSF